MWESPSGLSQAVGGIHDFYGFPQLRHFQSGLAATFGLQVPNILNHYMLWAPTQNPEEPHILIDGGSTDGTLEVARHFTHIEKIVSEPDLGIYDAMNKGLRLATGDIIGIINADDYYAHPRVLETIAKAFKDSQVDACYGDLVYVQRGPSSKNESPRPIIARYWESGNFSFKRFKWGWMPPHPTFFVRRRVYEKYGLFNLALGSAADYELMLRFLLRYKIRVSYIPSILVCMRMGGVSNSSFMNRMKANRMDRQAWKINGLKPYPFTTWLKPIRKIPQYFRKPTDSIFNNNAPSI